MKYGIMVYLEKSVKDVLNNTLRPNQNGRHFADYITFLNENCCISQSFNQQYTFIVPDDGLAPKRNKPLFEPMKI